MKRTKLKRNREGSIIVRGGTITKKEQKLFRNLVARANRRRAKRLETSPSVAIEKYKMFGKTSDFIMQKQSYSFNRFKTKEQFKTHLRYLKDMASGRFEKRRVEVYKENYKKGLINVYGKAETLELRKLINKMSDEEFKYRVETEQIESLSYQYYDPDNNKLERLTAQLNEKVYV